MVLMQAKGSIAGSIYDFILPGILLMDSGMVPAGGGAAARETGCVPMGSNSVAGRH